MMQRVTTIFALLGMLFLIAPGASAQNKKISALTAVTGINTASDDEFAIVDTGATETKRITRAELGIALGITIASTLDTAPTAPGTDAIAI